MAQLLAVGFIALGLIFAALLFIVAREKPAQLSTSKSKKTMRSTTKPIQLPLASSAQTQETNNATTPSHNANVVATTSTATVLQAQPVASVAKDDVPTVVEQAKPTSIAPNNQLLPAWWHEQFQSLTVQLQYLREHAKDVEQQIAILSEIARLAAELEAIQSKHVVLSEDKPLQFPHRVSREIMDGAYLTDKRPAVRKYTIKAM